MDGFKETKIGIIPENWDLIKSKDFCLRVTDGTHDTPKPQTDGYYLVTSKNLVDDKIDFSTCYYISERDFNQINQRSAVEQYDVLFGMIGTVGNTAIIDQSEIDFAIKNVGLFKLNGDIRKAAWLKNYLSSHIFSDYLKRQMAGTTQQFVGLGFLRKSPIPIPKNVDGTYDWKTISGINHVLSKVDDAIEATQKSINAAEKFKKALMQNLLTGKLKPDGTWRIEDEFWEDEKFGKVPVGWILGKVKKVIKLKNGKGNTTSNLKSEPTSGFNIPVFGGNGITGYYHTPLLTEKTLIVGRVGEYCGNVFLTPTESWVTDNAMLVDKFLIEDYSLEFFKYKFNTLNFIHYSDTTGQPKLTQGSIGSISFIYPESEIEQTKIADKINSVDIRLVNKQSKIKTLQRLKKSLMQNLLTGKVRLPEDFIKQFEIEENNKEVIAE